MRKAIVLLLVLAVGFSLASADWASERRAKLAEAKPMGDSAPLAAAPAGVMAGWVSVGINQPADYFNDIEILSGGVIWASGYNNTSGDDIAWRSTNNGATWDRIVCSITAQAGMVFEGLDANVAVLATYTGIIYRTTDAGGTWNQVYQYSTPDTAFFDHVKVIDANTLIAVGDADYLGLCVVKSTDAGLTWTRSTNLPALDATAYGWFAYATYRQCMDSYQNNVWIATYRNSAAVGAQDARVLKSTDAGATWTGISTPLAGGNAQNYYFRSIRFKDANIGYAVDRQVSSSLLNYWHKTTDGGLTWSDTLGYDPAIPNLNERSRSVAPIRGTNTVVAVGWGGSGANLRGKAWWSTDEGATWTSIDPNYPDYLTNVLFTDPTYGYALGQNQFYRFSAASPVTFRVNMKVKAKEGAFKPASDTVTVAGSFNGWAAGANILTDANSDSIYEAQIPIAPGGITYKFIYKNPGATNWEGDPNREYTVGEGNQILPVVYFDRDSVANIVAPVTFQVDMSVKMQEGTFVPATDKAVVAGSFNGWSTTANELSDLDGDSIYTATITDKCYEGTFYEYKFVKVRTSETNWEDNIGGNRSFTCPVGGTTLPVVYFDNDELVSLPTSGNILHTLDMTAYLNLGWFNPSIGDSLQIRGAWAPLTWDSNAPRLDPVAGSPGKYEFLQSYTGYTFDQFAIKFFMDLDPTSAPTRFPLYAETADGVQYEHPSERGDGNRIFNVGTGGNVFAPDVYFSDIDPRGTLAASDQVTITLHVDMTPATTFSVVFDPGTDSLFLRFQDALWRGSQIASQGAFTQDRLMTRVGTTNEYEVTFTVKGPTHYNLQYTYRYVDVASGSVVETGTGLGQQNPFYTRFIKPNGPNLWPTSYTAPLDTWKKTAPLPGEKAPDFTVGVDDGRNTPYVFELRQNYPNPFNPSTTIRYAIPEQSQVTLRVYNMLGQEVAMLVNGLQPAGRHTVDFDAKTLATGLYFYKLEAGKFSEVKKMMLLK